MAKPVTALMQKEMTRREFLMTLGLGMASVMGFSTIIHLLTGKSVSSHFQHRGLGYGSSVYGGPKHS